METWINDTVGYMEEQIMTIETLQNRCRLNEGRITWQEKMIEDLREKSLQLHAQLLHDNITFYNIPEKPSENVIAVLQDFMFLEMKTTEDDVRRVTFTKAYRMGERQLSENTRDNEL